MIKSTKPVISVCAVRTGSGKSQTTPPRRAPAARHGLKVAAIRHPMPYGDLATQKVQRFAQPRRPREAQVHHRGDGGVRAAHRRAASSSTPASTTGPSSSRREAEGATSSCGTAATTTCRSTSPTCTIVVADPLRVGNELTYYPGEANLRMADVGRHQQDRHAPSIEAIDQLRANIRTVNPKATVIDAASPDLRRAPRAADRQAGARRRGRPDAHPRRDEVRRRHGGRAQVRRERDRRPAAVHRRHDHRDVPEVPGHRHAAAGDGLRRPSRCRTSRRRSTGCRATWSSSARRSTSNRIVKIKKPTVRVTYELQEIGTPDLEQVVGTSS